MKILFVSPHPDDETLGCGGTIIKHKEAGDKIYWLIMSNITAEAGFDKEKVAARQKEIDTVVKEYGFERVFKLDFSAAGLDVVPRRRIIESVSDTIGNVMPDIIYIPYRNDVHSDHRVTFEAVTGCTKSFRYPSVKRVLMYEVVSETEFTPALQDNIFVPNSFSDISGYLERKISIMKIYRDELDEHPFPRSVENLRALATFRGATAGVKYAEAFMILKETW